MGGVSQPAQGKPTALDNANRMLGPGGQHIESSGATPSSAGLRRTPSRRGREPTGRGAYEEKRSRM
ncbi:MAG: hypothetical protein ABSA11_01170 [Candidatus Bathyarchaeia archaeon]